MFKLLYIFCDKAKLIFWSSHATIMEPLCKMIVKILIQHMVWLVVIPRGLMSYRIIEGGFGSKDVIIDMIVVFLIRPKLSSA